MNLQKTIKNKYINKHRKYVLPPKNAPQKTAKRSTNNDKNLYRTPDLTSNKKYIIKIEIGTKLIENIGEFTMTSLKGK